MYIVSNDKNWNTASPKDRTYLEDFSNRYKHLYQPKVIDWHYRVFVSFLLQPVFIINLLKNNHVNKLQKELLNYG